MCEKEFRHSICLQSNYVNLSNVSNTGLHYLWYILSINKQGTLYKGMFKCYKILNKDIYRKCHEGITGTLDN